MPKVFRDKHQNSTQAEIAKDRGQAIMRTSRRMKQKRSITKNYLVRT